MNSKLGILIAIILFASAPSHAAQPATNAKYLVLVDPDNAVSFSVLGGPNGPEQSIAKVGLAGWGPNWAWVGIESKEKPRGAFVVHVPFVVNRAAGQAIGVELGVRQAGRRSVAFTYDLSARKDVPLTLLYATIGIAKSEHGQMIATSRDKDERVTLPLSRGLLADISRLRFKLDNGAAFDAELSPAVSVSIDGDARITLAEQTFAAGKRTVTMTLSFPADVSLVTSPAEVGRYTTSLAGRDWFAFRPGNDLSPGAIGMEGWLEKPAGKHGGVRMVGDHFQLEDGTPIKFWGTNLAYASNCAPEKKVAEFTARRFAKYGINAVRLHKFTYPTNENGIGDRNDSTKFDPKGLDRLDYFASQLKNNGVYFGWSHTYGLHVRPRDRARLLNYDEIAHAFPNGNTYAFINFAPDVQALL